MYLPSLIISCYTSIEGLGNPWHLCQNRHKKDIKVFKLVPQIMYLQMHYQNLCSGKFLWAYFFTINNLSLQQSILYDIIVYMALNKTFNVFHVSIKTIPRKAKHFIRWNPLNYQPDLWQIVSTRNLSIRHLTLQAGIIFMQKIISHIFL